MKNPETSPATAQERLPREQETRASEARERMTFVPSSSFPQFQGDPAYVYRWVRVSSAGHTDGPNVSARMREGWVPVPSKEIPEIVVLADPKSRFKGMIEHGGHVLFKVSKERAEARRAYYADRSRRQAEGVENSFMKENDRRMPLFRQHRSEVKSTG